MLVPSSRLVSYLIISQNMDIHIEEKGKCGDMKRGREMKLDRICTHIDTKHYSFKILKALNIRVS